LSWLTSKQSASIAKSFQTELDKGDSTSKHKWKDLTSRGIAQGEGKARVADFFRKARQIYQQLIEKKTDFFEKLKYFSDIVGRRQASQHKFSDGQEPLLAEVGPDN
jgi:hypothetical protein